MKESNDWSSELSRLEKENDALRADLSRYREQYRYLQKQVLYDRLLKGKFQEVQPLQQALEALGERFPSKDYMLMYVQILASPQAKTGREFPSVDSLISRVENLAQEESRNMFSCNVAHVDTGVMCLLGSSIPDEARAYLPNVDNEAPPGENIIMRVNKMGLEIYDCIRAEFGIQSFVAISRPFPGVAGIPDAYLDAKEILDYRQLMNLDVPVLCYHDFEMADLDSDAGYDALQMEQEYLRQASAGDYSGARKTIHSILKHDSAHSLSSLHTTKIKTSAKLHALLLTMEQFQRDETFEPYNQLLEKLRQMEEDSITIPELHQLIDTVFDQIDTYVWGYYASRSPRWLSELLSYISEHFREPEMTVAYLSERLQMNPSYLSRTVKRVTGYSLFDYIQLKRLQSARAMLTTGGSVQEAADGSGFSDTRSMRRAFQKYLQANPSDYNGQKDADPLERL